MNCRPEPARTKEAILHRFKKFAAASVFGFALGLAAQAPSSPLYIPVAQGPEPGHAPAMRVQRLTAAGQQPAEYALIFGAGDEVASGLLSFAQQYNIASAHFTAIGALHDARFGWLDRSRKAYKSISINQQVEALSLVGDIARANGKPVVHAHLVVGQKDGTAHGGHLLEAHVYPTLEVMVTVDSAPLERSYDAATGLSLIHPKEEKQEETLPGGKQK